MTTRYATHTTDAVRQARQRLITGLENPRLTGSNRERTLAYLREAEAELISRAGTPAVSHVELVQTGWTSTRLQASSPVSTITVPATGEVIGYTMLSRGYVKAFDAKDRKLGEYWGTGVEAQNRAADRVWQAHESRSQRVAA